MELTQVKRVGPSAADKLVEAGIKSVEELAEIDLRKADVNGLSSENIAQLRDNAIRFLKAQKDSSQLTLVDGLGPSAAEKLKEAGVDTIEELAELDLRKSDIDGLSTDHIQKLKRNARYLLPGAA